MTRSLMPIPKCDDKKEFKAESPILYKVAVASSRTCFVFSLLLTYTIWPHPNGQPTPVGPHNEPINEGLPSYRRDTKTPPSKLTCSCSTTSPPPPQCKHSRHPSLHRPEAQAWTTQKDWLSVPCTFSSADNQTYKYNSLGPPHMKRERYQSAKRWIDNR